MTDRPAATVTFRAEAYDFAHVAYANLIGITVFVVPLEGEPFTGNLQSIEDGHERDDGQFIAHFAVADQHGTPTDVERAYDIYNELQRVEVL